MLLALLLLASAPPFVAKARVHLAAGKLDEVLFDLDGKSLDEADKPAAVDILAHAAEAAYAKQDLVLSLQFAQMALRLRPDDLLALEVGARAARSQKQYGPAEQYAERWMTQSNNGARARLLRAELALDDGEWAHALELIAPASEGDLSEEERRRMRVVRLTARKELSGRRPAAQARVTGPSFEQVYCLTDSDCLPGSYCSKLALWTDSSWRQTVAPPSHWTALAVDDSTWNRAVEEGRFGIQPWGSFLAMPQQTPAFWIWNADTRARGDSSAVVVYFRKQFTAPAKELTLTMTADDEYELYVDGVLLGSAQSWMTPHEYALDFLPGSTHVVALRVVNNGGAGGVLLEARSPWSVCQVERAGDAPSPERPKRPDSGVSSDRNTP